jgi:hypothetical protein
MVEELGGRRACSRLRLWCDTTLVTMAHESAACVDLLSHVGICSVLGFVVWFRGEGSPHSNSPPGCIEFFKKIGFFIPKWSFPMEENK